MDIKKVILEISALEMEKARLEVEVRQIEERTEAAAKKMAELGVDSTTIYAEIERLEASITERLLAAKGASASKAKQSVALTGAKVEDWMK